MGLSHTVSGDIASFRTPSRVPIESLKFHFLPKQASGTPSPENPIPIEGWTGLNGYMSGYNVLPFDSVIPENYTAELDGVTATYSNGIMHMTGNHNKAGWSNVIWFYTTWMNNPIVLPAGTYTVSDGLAVVCKIDDAAYANQGGTFTVKNRALVQGFYAAVRGEGPVDIYLPLVLTVGTKRPKKYLPYKPITNIPITFPTGKNLLNTMDVDNLLWSNTVSPGRIDTVSVGTGNSNFLKFNQIFHAGTYTISGKISGPGVKAIRLLCSSQITSSIWNSYYSAYFIDVLINGKWTFTLTEDSTIGVCFVIADGHGNEPASIYDLQLEYGNDATTYEPWSPINTFYGGYIDPVAGEIVAEYTKKVFNGSESGWGTIGDDWNTDNTGFCIRVSELTHIIDSNNIIKGNLLRRSLYYNITYGQFYVAKDSWANFRLRMTESMTLQEFKTFLSQNNLEIVYPIATPVHIPIPAEDLKAFLDHNNFWSDANDITEVTYAVTESKDILATRKKAMDFDHARHKKVKWNQFAREASSSYWRPYSTNYAALTFENGVGIRTTLANCDASYADAIRSINQPIYYRSHKYYISQELYSSVSKQYVNIIGSLWQNMQTANANEWTRISYVGSPGTSDDGVGKPLWTCYSAHTYSVEGEICKFRNVMFIDLTLMFGEGNEPTKAEFEHICELNGIDLTTYQPYDEGSDRWLIIP